MKNAVDALPQLLLVFLSDGLLKHANRQANRYLPSVETNELDFTEVVGIFFPECSTQERLIHSANNLRNMGHGASLRLGDVAVAGVDADFPERRADITLWISNAGDLGLLIAPRAGTYSARMDSNLLRLTQLGSWSWNPESGENIWSDSQYDIFGIDKAGFTPTYEAFIALVHPEDRATLQDFLGAVLQGTARFHRLVYRIVRPDGDIRWIRADADVLSKQDGTVTELVGTVLDITDREKYRLELEFKNRQMELALVSSGLVTWDWDLRTNVTRTSTQFFSMLGYARDETTFSHLEWVELIHPDDAPAVRKVVERYLSGQDDYYEVQYRLKRADGSWMWAQSRGKVIERDAASQPLRFIGTTRDISREKWIHSESEILLGKIQGFIESIATKLPGVAQDGSDAGLTVLTPRQKQLAKLICDGKTSEEIAKILHIARSTAVSHRQALMKKLAVHTTAELVKMLISKRVID